MHQNHLEGLLKPRVLSLSPEVSESVGLGWGLRIFIPNKAPGDGDAAGLGNHTLRTTDLDILGYFQKLRTSYLMSLLTHLLIVCSTNTVCWKDLSGVNLKSVFLPFLPIDSLSCLFDG